MPARAKRGPGRRPGESKTRDAILAAARVQFAEHGYKGATLRAIATDADVDPTLVMHYFGSKRALFAVALEWPFDPATIVEQVGRGPRSQIGWRLARFVVSIWDDEQTRAPIMALLRGGIADSEAASVLRGTLEHVFLRPVGDLLDTPDASLRLSLCSSQIVGAGLARYVFKLEPLASLTSDDFADLLGRPLQHFMTGKL